MDRLHLINLIEKEKEKKNMPFIKKIFKILVIAAFGLFLSLLLFILIGLVQSALFVPENFIMWISKSPYSTFMLFYPYLIISSLFILIDNDFRLIFRWIASHVKNHKNTILFSFVLFNALLAYSIMVNTAVISDGKIVDHSFFSPGGIEYDYDDIEHIITGVYGKEGFSYSKGDFYYILEFSDENSINLSEMAGSKDDEDHRFIIERLDRELVELGISKTSSLENFEYATDYLDSIYTDKIKSILINGQ